MLELLNVSRTKTWPRHKGSLIGAKKGRGENNAVGQRAQIGLMPKCGGCVGEYAPPRAPEPPRKTDIEQLCIASNKNPLK